ncbi:MAG: hypothetical protein J0M15_00520 [Deltaproteobacteria bacterium]|nr:hypothetical protein [Deltaproteobacteria bacterium]
MKTNIFRIILAFVLMTFGTVSATADLGNIGAPADPNASTTPYTDNTIGGTTPSESPTVVPTASEASAAASTAGGEANKANLIAAGNVSQLTTLKCEGLITVETQKLKAACLELKASATSCNGKYDMAAPICNPESNANLLSTISQVQGLMSVAQGLMDSCNKFGKAMNLAKMGMAGYTLACGTVQKACDISCSSAVKDLETFNAASGAAKAELTSCVVTFSKTNPLKAADCQNDLYAIQALDALAENESATTGPTVTAKAKVCKVDITTLLGLAAINLGALAQSKMMADKCEKQTKAKDVAAKTAEEKADCTKTENAAKAECLNTNGLVDCAVTTNADKPICICKANPRLKGCEGISTALATNSTMSSGSAGGVSGGSGRNALLTNAPGSAADKKFPNDLAKSNRNDGSGSGAYGSSGGSSAGLTGSSDGGAKDGELEKKGALGNANILGTEGGGGSGRFGYGGGSYGSGDKAQLRKLATANGFKGKSTGNNWKDQVTSNAGKSNFDKIKVRYNENRASLLGR